MVRALLLLVLAGGGTAPRAAGEPVGATFSIVAYDPDTKELGVAVQSRFIAVGSVVPWAKAGVGAVATQSYANTTYGPKALDLMSQGVEPEKVMSLLTDIDPKAADRTGALSGHA